MPSLKSLKLFLVFSLHLFTHIEAVSFDRALDATSLVPRGTNETINDVLTYVTLPEGGEFEEDKAVLLLTDAVGLYTIDNLLLADQWASAGFATYVPDLLNGDPFDGNPDDIDAWMLKHGEAETTPLLLAVLDELKGHGIRQIAVAGYCLGGLYTLRLAQNNSITVGTVAHPSFLVVPDDFELLLNQSHVPLEINNAELDTLPALTTDLVPQVDEVLGGGKYKPGYLRRQFEGVGHGFAIYANASDPVQVAAKQGAFDTSLAFVREHMY